MGLWPTCGDKKLLRVPHTSLPLACVGRLSGLSPQVLPHELSFEGKCFSTERSEVEGPAVKLAPPKC